MVRSFYQTDGCLKTVLTGL